MKHQQNISDVIQQRRFRWIGGLKRMGSDRISEMMPAWNNDGRRRNRKPREEDGWNKMKNDQQSFYRRKCR